MKPAAPVTKTCELMRKNLPGGPSGGEVFQNANALRTGGGMV
jgi:hypothetical protein